MKRQLSLNLPPEQLARMDDFVGPAAARLESLTGTVLVLGAPGTGKSHLLQGSCREATERGQQAIYLAALSRVAPSILEGLERYALVCLDDVDTVLDQQPWQVALFHLLNACRDSHTRLLLAGGDSRAFFEARLPDLASRFRAAYRVPLEPLDDAQKLEVIRRKARRRGFDMGEDVCRFILARADRDMHHLSKLVEQLDEETLRRQKRVTIPFVKQALGL